MLFCSSKMILWCCLMAYMLSVNYQRITAHHNTNHLHNCSCVGDPCINPSLTESSRRLQAVDRSHISETVLVLSSCLTVSWGWQMFFYRTYDSQLWMTWQIRPVPSFQWARFTQGPTTPCSQRKDTPGLQETSTCKGIDLKRTGFTKMRVWKPLGVHKGTAGGLWADEKLVISNIKWK